MLRLATVFSGIGAIEHSLRRLSIPYEIVFACDNGERELKETRDQIEETISGISDYHKRKEYIEQLYMKNRKTNYVQKSYMANYELDRDKFYQDARFLDGRQFRQEVDLFVGGSPCQSFSMVGKRGGFDDTRGTLFYEFARLIKEIRPRVFIYENVKGVLSHDNGNTWAIMQNVFNDLGYNWNFSVLNSKNYGIPQNRERLFVVGFLKHDVNFKFPDPVPLKIKMKDLLLDNVADKYYLGEKGIRFVTDEKHIRKQYTQINGDIALCQKANQQFNWHGDFVFEPFDFESAKGQEIDDKYFLSKKLVDYVMASGTKDFYSKPKIDLEVARPLLSTMHKMHRSGVDNYVTSRGRIRKLTPRECLRLMGFNDDFEIVVSDTQMYRQAGNSIVVNVLMHILVEIFKTEDLTSENEYQISMF